MRHQTATFFLGALLVSGLVQGVLLSHTSLIDEGVWLKRVESFANDIKQQPGHFEQNYYGGQPGMSFVSMAGFLHIGGLSSQQSLVVTLVVFNAIMLAGIYTLLYQLHPTTYWWLAGGSLLLLHPFYLKSTPTNLLISLLVVLLFLLALKIHESRPTSLLLYLALGASIGFGLANRFTDTLLFAVGIAVPIVPLTKKQFGMVVGSALTTACVFDPLFLTEPIAHVQFIVHRVAVHYTTLPGAPISFSEISLMSPFLLIAIFLSICFLAFPQRLPSPISKKFLAAMLLVSGVMVASTLAAKAASGRYLFPIILLWEVFLPLFLFHLGENSRFLKNTHQRQLKLMAVITFLVVGGQLLLIHTNL